MYRMYLSNKVLSDDVASAAPENLLLSVINFLKKEHQYLFLLYAFVIILWVDRRIALLELIKNNFHKFNEFFETKLYIPENF